MSVRIFGGGGGKIIKDATATPSDVRQTKVFYNNDGRQVGNAKIAMETQKIFAKGYIPETEWFDKYTVYIEITPSSNDKKCGVNLFRDYAKITPKCENQINGRLIGITINGEYFDYPFPRDEQIQPSNQTGYDYEASKFLFSYKYYRIRIEQYNSFFKIGVLYCKEYNTVEGFPEDTVITFLSI